MWPFSGLAAQRTNTKTRTNRRRGERITACKFINLRRWKNLFLLCLSENSTYREHTGLPLCPVKQTLNNNQQQVQSDAHWGTHKFILVFYTHYLRLIKRWDRLQSKTSEFSTISRRYTAPFYPESTLLFYLSWDWLLSSLWPMCPHDVCLHTHGFVYVHMCVWVCLCLCVCLCGVLAVTCQVPRWNTQQEFTASRQLLQLSQRLPVLHQEHLQITHQVHTHTLKHLSWLCCCPGDSQSSSHLLLTLRGADQDTNVAPLHAL